jgi:hypothetical protein
LHTIARGAQYGHRRMGILGLEVIGERIDEQHHIGVLRGRVIE